jgi:hypothetical protein
LSTFESRQEQTNRTHNTTPLTQGKHHHLNVLSVSIAKQIQIPTPTCLQASELWTAGPHY